MGSLLNSYLICLSGWVQGQVNRSLTGIIKIESWSLNQTWASLETQNPMNEREVRSPSLRKNLATGPKFILLAFSPVSPERNLWPLNKVNVYWKKKRKIITFFLKYFSTYIAVEIELIPGNQGCHCGLPARVEALRRSGDWWNFSWGPSHSRFSGFLNGYWLNGLKICILTPDILCVGIRTWILWEVRVEPSGLVCL